MAEKGRTLSKEALLRRFEGIGVRLDDVEAGRKNKVLILPNAPDPEQVNHYIDQATGAYLYWDGAAWVNPLGGGGGGGGSGPLPTRTSSYSLGGTNGSRNDLTNFQVRHVVRLPVATSRYRLRMMNANVRDEARFAGAVKISGLWTGKHDAPPGAWTADFRAGTVTRHPVKNGALSEDLPAGGGLFLTDWIEDEASQLVAHEDRVISFGVQCAAGQVLGQAATGSAVIGTPSTGGGDAAGGALQAPNANFVNNTPLMVVVEYEFEGNNLVGVVTGDSISQGQGVAPRRIASSWGNLFALMHDVPMVLHGAGGSTAADWAANNATGAKYEIFPFDAIRPDFIIQAHPTNDVGGLVGAPNGTTEEVVAAAKGNLGVIANRFRAINPEIVGHFGRILPRGPVVAAAGGWTQVKEDARLQLNDWMATGPFGYKSAFFFDQAVRAPSDPSVMAGEFQTDAIHPDAAGHVAMMARVNIWRDPHAASGGTKGDRGAPGLGIPPGGQAGQVLKKFGGGDFEVSWGDDEAGGGGGGSSPQYERRTYVAGAFATITNYAVTAATFNAAVIPNVVVSVPALGAPPDGYEWRLNILGSLRFRNASANMGILLAAGFDGARATATNGGAYVPAGSFQIPVPVSVPKTSPPRTDAPFTVNFTVFSSATGTVDIIANPMPYVECYLEPVA